MALLSLAVKLLAASVCIHGSAIPHAHPRDIDSDKPNAKILILGGGVAGVMAARTFHDKGIKDFIIIEARDELGGRLKSASFGGATVELGANWVQGTQSSPGGRANPIFELVEKHKVKTHPSDFLDFATYDQTGAVDYSGAVQAAEADYENLIVSAGARVARNIVDTTARTGYTLTGSKPKDAYANVAEYFLFDWEFAQKPDQTSWVASSWVNNFTFGSEYGFSPDNLLAIDPRGFKTFIQEEANEFISPSQLRLSSVVKTISWSGAGVTIVLDDGSSITGDYALCTFSLGVLQNDDVKFEPTLPPFKLEAIASMTMGTFTKIFLHFPEKFWFDTEIALYADPERGRYPVWQNLDQDTILPDSGILFAMVTGDFSERIEALSDDKVQEEVMGVLRSMYPNVTIPDPLDFTFPRWHADPLYRGSYSNWPSSFFREHHDNLRANVDRLYFAGEATSQKYFGYLQGAYFEGVDVATEVIRCIKDNQCAGLEHFEAVVNAFPYHVAA